MLLGAVVLLAGCSTVLDVGDGKQLQDFDPADYPTTTTPTTVSDTVAGTDLLTGDASDGAALPGDANAEAFSVTTAWPDGGAIDVAYTCDGADTAPAVSWGAVPDGTVEIALALVDDSAVSGGQPFAHWVIGGLDPNEIALADGDVPPGSLQALNFFGDIGYGGPCPPSGDEAHVYRLTAYALSQQLEVVNGGLATQFLNVISATAIASTDVTGTYQR